ncbi:MAG: hypothetical protein V7710_14020, partial [Pseudoalteromonas distincta]
IVPVSQVIESLANTGRFNWWFWTIYTFGMYFVDFTMALVLIINKDVLGLNKLLRYVRRLSLDR